MRGCMTFPINFIVTLFNNKYVFVNLQEDYLFCHYRLYLHVPHMDMFFLLPASYQIDPYYQNVLSSFLQKFSSFVIYFTSRYFHIYHIHTKCLFCTFFIYLRLLPQNGSLYYNIFLHIHTRIHFRLISDLSE